MVADIRGVLDHTEVSAGRSAASPSRGRLAEKAAVLVRPEALRDTVLWPRPTGL